VDLTAAMRTAATATMIAAHPRTLEANWTTLTTDHVTTVDVDMDMDVDVLVSVNQTTTLRTTHATHWTLLARDQKV